MGHGFQCITIDLWLSDLLLQPLMGWDCVLQPLARWAVECSSSRGADWMASVYRLSLTWTFCQELSWNILTLTNRSTHLFLFPFARALCSLINHRLFHCLSKPSPLLTQKWANTFLNEKYWSGKAQGHIKLMHCSCQNRNTEINSACRKCLLVLIQ